MKQDQHNLLELSLGNYPLLHRELYQNPVKIMTSYRDISISICTSKWRLKTLMLKAKQTILLKVESVFYSN